MNSSSFVRSFAATAVAVALCFVMPALARADGDDGGPSVARIGLADGNVAVQRGDGNASTAAAINAPVLPGDYITTGQPGRAEVQLDGRSIVRIGENAQVRLAALDPGNRAVQLAAGTVAVRLYPGSSLAIAVDTPSVTVRPRQSGLYRITVTPDGKTDVTVRGGQTAVETPSGAQILGPGTTLIAQGPASGPSITTTTAVAFDDFDRFDGDRDHADAAPPNVAYANPNIDGLADVDANGQWVQDPSYGQVWIPAGVPAGWAPYRDGRWAWENGYGWTWVSAEPWGWAPYHYGSWYHSVAYGWGWVPPSPVVVAPWRPAMVAFLSFGIGTPGFSVGVNFGGVGIGFGNIGWVPLAPGEAWHPWWGPHWGTSVTNVNVTNVTNINVVKVYRNAAYPGAVTGVNGQRFVQGDFTHNVAVAPSQLRQAQVVHGALPVVPSARNLQYSDRPVPAQLAAHPAFANHTFAGSAVTPSRTPFQQERSAMTAYVSHATPGANAAPAAARPIENAQPGFANNGAWRQFNAQRGTPNQEAAFHAAASQPQRQPAAAAEVPAPQTHAAWAGDANSRPSYAMPGRTTAAEPAAKAPEYNRATAPEYTRAAAPAQPYSRPAASYARPASPSYASPARVPAYHAPAAASHAGAAAAHRAVPPPR